VTFTRPYCSRIGDDANERNAVAVALHTALAVAAGKVRMLGSAAVDLAFVADGTLDVSITLQPGLGHGRRRGDRTARRAHVTDTDGSPHDIMSRTTIVTTPGLTTQLLNTPASGHHRYQVRLGRTFGCCSDSKGCPAQGRVPRPANSPIS
jgi:hypothetical protein